MNSIYRVHFVYFSQKTQALADQAWEKVRLTGSLQQGLERECADLRTQLLDMQEEHRALLATCALLAGAFYPLYQRNGVLALQRDVLSEQLVNFGVFKAEVQKLVDALSLDKQDSPRTQAEANRGRKPAGLLRFRYAAVAVMAVNRLRRAPADDSRLFTLPDGLPGGFASVSVVAGDYRDSPPLARTRRSDVTSGDDGAGRAVEWLCSGNLLSTILATMSDLVATLHKARQGGKLHVKNNFLNCSRQVLCFADPCFDHERVVQSARTCFQKFICHLPATFLSSNSDVTCGFRERNSTMRMLGFGLNRALAQGVAHDSARPSALEGSLSLSDSLQQHILEFTKRLHMAEVERRDLRLQVRGLHRCLLHITQLHSLYSTPPVSAEATQAATQTSGGERIQREVSQQSTALPKYLRVSSKSADTKTILFASRCSATLWSATGSSRCAANWSAHCDANRKRNSCSTNRTCAFSNSRSGRSPSESRTL